jgi:hypothetical protein
MQKFLQQGMHQRLDFAASLTALQQVLAENPEPTPETRVTS